MRPPVAAAMVAVWVAAVVASIGANALAFPARLREYIVPCASPGTATLGQMTAAEQEALRAMGGTPAAVLIWGESVVVVTLVGCLAVGAVIYLRRRTSWIAFVASLFLVFVAVSIPFNLPALARENPALLPVADGFHATSLVLVALLLYLFPSGRFTPRWTRWVMAGWGVYQGVRVAFPGSRIGVTASHAQLAMIPDAALFAGGVANQVWRYRRQSRPVERQQIKWAVTAFAIHVAVFAVVVATTLVYPALSDRHLLTNPAHSVLYEFVLFHVYMLTFWLIPAALLFSILRYRLWDIDYLINRSLVYGLLTAGLLLLFAVTAAALQQLVQLLDAPGGLPVALALALVAAGGVFQPTRRALLRLVDRRVYGIAVEVRPSPTTYADANTLSFTGADSRTLPGELRPLELIGNGSMGSVYRAEDPVSGRQVAVKVQPPEVAQLSREYAHRFDREIRVVRSLRHPNIVRVLDSGQTAEGLRYLVMDYVEGGTLAKYLSKRGALPVGAARALWAISPPGCTMRTSVGSSIGISSPPTCCWTAILARPSPHGPC